MVKREFGERPKSHSDIRWFSFWDQVYQLFLHAHLIRPVLTELEREGICPASTEKCLDEVNAGTVFAELAVMVDALAVFRHACYFLEGVRYVSAVCIAFPTGANVSFLSFCA